MIVYRGISPNQVAHRRRAADVLRWVLVALVIVVILGFRVVSASLYEQSALSVRTTILNAAEQCYAIEGAYPPSLDYLVEKYGIRVDTNEYVVNYVAFAGNIQPTVAVTLK